MDLKRSAMLRGVEEAVDAERRALTAQRVAELRADAAAAAHANAMEQHHEGSLYPAPYKQARAFRATPSSQSGGLAQSNAAAGNGVRLYSPAIGQSSQGGSGPQHVDRYASRGGGTGPADGQGMTPQQHMTHPGQSQPAQLQLQLASHGHIQPAGEDDMSAVYPNLLPTHSPKLPGGAAQQQQLQVDAFSVSTYCMKCRSRWAHGSFAWHHRLKGVHSCLGLMVQTMNTACATMNSYCL